MVTIDDDFVRVEDGGAAEAVLAGEFADADLPDRLAREIGQPDLAAANRSLDSAISTLRRELNFLRVVNAATAIRREMLFYSRTPDRMAEVIGTFVDRDGNPDATELFFAGLDRLYG